MIKNKKLYIIVGSIAALLCVCATIFVVILSGNSKDKEVESTSKITTASIEETSSIGETIEKVTEVTTEEPTMEPTTELITKPSVEKEPGSIEKLHVSGTKLVNASGQQVQLKGISTHGLSWFPQYVNENCFKQIHEEMGVDIVRLAMYSAEYNGYCTGGDKTQLENLVKKGVEYATKNQMYVIIDWHVHEDNNPNTYINQAKEFFAKMAKEYKDYDNIFYEICNEPSGGTTWQDIKSYAYEIIKVIREYDKDGIIIVGTPNWCQYVMEAANDPITGYSNIMYTLHFYAATHKGDLRREMENAINKGLPIFVTEYGICDASGAGAIDEYEANQWVELMNKYGISYIAWNLSNKAETSAIINSSCNKIEGFSYDDFSPSGKWLIKTLTGQ